MTTIEDLKDKSVAILGFGQEGQAIADYLISKGVVPKIFDGKNLAEWKESNLAKLKHLNLTVQCSDDFVDQALSSCEVIFRSPGIRISPEQISTALEKNILITSQTQWFFEHSPAKIIGVTGTKGKGTTSSLIYEILKQSDEQENRERNVYLTGNIGKIQPFEFLGKLKETDIVVYELSSFQLQNLQQSPYIGVCLMITSDHLDYHRDLEEYHQAKSAIAEFQTEQDFLIFNNDYEATKKIGSLGNGQKYIVTKNAHEIERGAIIDDATEQIILKKSETETCTIDTSQRLIKGKHNLENIAAASLVTYILGVDPKIIQEALTSFAGLKHRLQFVTEKQGVKYYNDSVSTNPDTTLAAIRSFTEPLILIVGGAVKNLDYTNLVVEMTKTKNLKAVVCMGPAGKIIFDLLKQHNFTQPIYGPYFDFVEIINTAQRLATNGDIVLLSPGATSFDMFTSYAERGDKFINLVTS